MATIQSFTKFSTRTEVEDQNRVPREVKGYVRDFTELRMVSR